MLSNVREVCDSAATVRSLHWIIFSTSFNRSCCRSENDGDDVGDGDVDDGDVDDVDDDDVDDDDVDDDDVGDDDDDDDENGQSVSRTSF